MNLDHICALLENVEADAKAESNRQEEAFYHRGELLDKADERIAELERENSILKAQVEALSALVSEEEMNAAWRPGSRGEPMSCLFNRVIAARLAAAQKGGQ